MVLVHNPGKGPGRRGCLLHEVFMKSREVQTVPHRVTCCTHTRTASLQEGPHKFHLVFKKSACAFFPRALSQMLKPQADRRESALRSCNQCASPTARSPTPPAASGAGLESKVEEKGAEAELAGGGRFMAVLATTGAPAQRRRSGRVC